MINKFSKISLEIILKPNNVFRAFQIVNKCFSIVYSFVSLYIILYYSSVVHNVAGGPRVQIGPLGVFVGLFLDNIFVIVMGHLIIDMQRNSRG